MEYYDHTISPFDVDVDIIDGGDVDAEGDARDGVNVSHGGYMTNCDRVGRYSTCWLPRIQDLPHLQCSKQIGDIDSIGACTVVLEESRRSMLSMFQKNTTLCVFTAVRFTYLDAPS